ncbi:putative ATP-dependent RNA helicase TDRD12 [Thrips palmi]|uniref:RNA helicase n=1 Tax=Thrips palmi TaxID=161013 RepID=A0A6P8Y9X8_THRPL|nr:putative ATP-dependent RNA helicase TDRD12 [Thrips palmi]XP_034230572.1 putative ATP-dependent RNA helicase TDRD12 [Thrips palmi]
MDEHIPKNALHIQINKFRTPASVWATEIAGEGMSEERLQLYLLESELGKTFKRNRKKEPSLVREADDIVAVQSLNNSNLWHRGKIECRMELQTGPKYKVFLLDHGLTFLLRPEKLYSIPYKLPDVPYQALVLMLEGIVPTSLTLSPDLQNFHPEISEGWTPAAEHFVNDVRNSYLEAYFVEKSRSPRGNARYGDILIKMPDNEKLFSLSTLLCEKKFAKYNQVEFERRQQVEMDASETSECESPLSFGYSTDTSTSFSPSPARSMMSSQRPSMMEYLQSVASSQSTVASSQSAQEAPVIPEPLPQSSSDGEHIVRTSPQTKGRLSFLEQLKKSKSASNETRTNEVVLTQTCSSSSTPTKVNSSVEEQVSAPLHSQSAPEELSAPKSLGACFVPAGYSAKKEPKHNVQSQPHSSRSPLKSSDSEDSFSSSSKQSMKSCQNGPSTPNGRDLMFKTKLMYSSDSSTSDSSLQRRGPAQKGPANCSLSSSFQTARDSSDGATCHSSNSSLQSSPGSMSLLSKLAQKRPVPPANCPLNSSSQTAQDSNDSASCHSNDSSLQSSSGLMSLLSKLRKQQTPPSSRTDESTSSESTAGITELIPARQPDQDKQIPLDSSSLMRNRLLSGPKIPVTDHVLPNETFLSRSVLLHGGLRPVPWVNFNDVKLKFSSTIEKYLQERRWCYNILTLEKYMWPAIQLRQNVVMISPKRSGKTSSYIIPIMDFMCSQEETLKGCGPLALILCSGSKSATNIYEECIKIVRNMKNPPQVQVVYGLTVANPLIFKLINGCEIFITTPPCLLRIMNKHGYALTFRRLQHLILDEADIMMTRFLKEIKEIQAKVVAEQTIRPKDEPIQIVVSSEKWEPHLLSFSEHLRGNPLLCINDCFEACVYGKPDVIFHLTQSGKKLSKLIEILKSQIGLQKTVVFCDATEVSRVEEFIENACLNYLVVRPGIELRHIETILSSWNSSKAGHHYILLCPDSEFYDLKITDATSIVHYSFPIDDKSYFVKRLSAILGNLPNKMEVKTLKTTNLSPSIHLLMDESNTEQLPVIVQLMQRIAGKLDQKYLDLAKSISMNKERRTKINKLFCKNIKMFGQCINTVDCSNRHVFVNELDLSEILPSSGHVSMQVTQVHSAGHYSVRLVEHIDVDGKKKKWPSGYVKIGLLMSSHFRKESSRICVGEINVGDLFAVETEIGLFQRVQILEVKDRDKYGKPLSMLVQFLDEGHHDTVKEYMLHELPEDLKAFPAQVVDVFLCGLQPADQDSDFGADANWTVKKWLKSTNESEDSRQTLLQGQIMLSMAGSLWIDPVYILEWLPLTREHITRRNINQSLLRDHLALPNPEHLPNLFKLCGKEPLVLSSVNAAVQCPIKPREQAKPSWAFLEAEIFEEINFISAESVSVFFVRKVKFEPLLHELIKDINTKGIPRKSEEVSLLSPGSICLASHKDEWHRVIIRSQNEDHSFTVFYVDYGDFGNVTHEQIKCIPDWAITRLPFQAIECSLAGIASCDTVDKLYDVADCRSLLAKICKKKDATLTSGNHYVIVIIDCSKQVPSILNKDLLELEGVGQCAEEMELLDFELDESLLNKCSNMVRAEPEMPVSQHNTDYEDPDLDLSDLEFKEEDLSGFVDNDTDDGLGNFEIFGLDLLAESFKKENKEAVEELAKQLQASALAPQHQQPPLKKAASREPTHQAEKAHVVQADGDGDSDWEVQEYEYIGRSVLPVLCSARPPTTKWLEDLYFVWIKICVTGVENYFLKWTCDRFQFSTSVNGRLYHIDQQLRGAIVPSSVSSVVKGFSVEIKMRKAYSGLLWERLLFPLRKFAWLTPDLEAIDLDSSDSEGEDTLKTLNKEIRKIPLKLRRRPLDKYEKSQQVRPDLESDSPDSNCEYEMVDSDEMF